MLGVSSLTKAYTVDAIIRKIGSCSQKFKISLIGDYTEMSKSDKGAYQRNVGKLQTV